MNQKGFVTLLIAIIIIIGIISSIGYIYLQRKNTETNPTLQIIKQSQSNIEPTSSIIPAQSLPPNNSQNRNSNNNVKQVTGIITKTSNDLAVDGNCEIEVDGLRTVLQFSGERKPEGIPKEKGVIEGIICQNASDSLSQYVGHKVEAFGAWNDHYLTIEGDKGYYIRVY